ncbi:MAG: hypothetical protein HYX72_02045 [Acidobacteria bacterium]|nr:hypothetical protein [Acidobacteriota bacterium]
MKFLAARASKTGRLAVLLLILFLLVWGLSGCLVRRRERIPAAAPSAPIWKTASLNELLEKLESQTGAIQTQDITATIEPSVSSLDKGEIVHYRDVRTFILIRKPAFIRMIGLYPVVQNKAFDMASNGETFQVYIPLKNRFIIGKNETEKKSKSAIENLRPQVILQALLFQGPEPGKEQAMLQSYSEGVNSYYIVHIVRTEPGQPLLLSRNIWFERRNLTVVRLEMFDEAGDAVTDVRYSSYADFSGITYPRDIVVDRPKDLYGLHLVITNVQFNQPIADDKFLLDQPPQTELINLGGLPQLKALPQRKRDSKVG